MAVVAILSILLSGWIGMLINHQVAKGLLYGLLGGILVGVLTCGFGLIIWWPLTAIDAIVVASRLNRGEPVGQWQFF